MISQDEAPMTARFLTCLLTTATIGALILMPRTSQGEEPKAPPLAGDLAQYIERARREFNVPGLAVGIVKDGQVIFERGFGESSLQDHRPVSARTLFCIASNTKSITGTALEILADEGKLHLEDRVVDHLPWFRMGDPYVTHEIRVRDLLAHRSGLGSHAGDLLFVTPSTYTTREVVERLRDVPLASGFRATFAYENLMYAVAALVIEQASGESYADFVREHIFTPAGMSDSHIDATELKPTDDVATPYALRDGKLTALPTLVWKNNPGAAGIYSTAHDMTKWAGAQLAVSRMSAQRPLLSPASQQRMWSIITPIDIDPAPIPEADAVVEFTADQNGRINGANLRRASPATPHAYDYQDLHLVRTSTNQ
jgi:CubicO group peptidase (beta-lactamase class C family)